MSLPDIEVDSNGDEGDGSPDVEVPAPAIAYLTCLCKPNLADNIIDIDEAPEVKPTKSGARAKCSAKRAVGKKALDTDFGMYHWFLSHLSLTYVSSKPHRYQ